MWNNKNIFFILLFFCALLLMLTKTAPTSLNEVSRLLTADSLLTDRNFSLFESPSVMNTGVDLIFSGVHWYSDKPPLFSLFTALVYRILFRGPMVFLTSLAVSPSLQFYLTTFVMSGIPMLVLLYFFYRSLTLVGVQKYWSTVYTLLLGCGTMILPFATVYSAHIVTALAFFVSFYCLLRLREKTQHRFFAASSGFWIGLGMALDPATSVLLCIGFFTFLFLRQDKEKEKERLWIWFLCGLLPWGIVAIWLNVVTTGTVLPWYFIYRYFRIVPQNANRIDMVVLSPLRALGSYANALLLNKRALLLTSPIMVYALWFFVQACNRGAHYAKEAWAVAFGSIGFFLVIFAITNDFGGATRTVRWLLPFVPLWFWFLAASFHPTKAWAKNIFLGTALVSVCITLAITLDPWAVHHNYSLWATFASLRL